MDSSQSLYQHRREPTCLVIKKGVNYINIRECKDKLALESVLAELDAFGVDAVLVPWSSPPFHIIRGYGLYSQSEINGIYDIEQREHWVSRRLGVRLDRSYFLTRLNRIDSSYRTIY